MKTRKSTTLIMYASILMVILASVIGCSKKDIYDQDPITKLPVFDFSTRASYNLDLKYNVPDGYNVYFEVYTEMPVGINAEGKTVLKAGAKSIDKGYTDEKGVYNKKISIPAFVKEIYIYSPYAGVPRLLVSEIKDGALSKPVLSGVETVASGVNSMFSRGGAANIAIDGITMKTLGDWVHNLDGYTKFPNADENVLPMKEAKIWGRPSYLEYVDQTNFTGGKPALNVSAAVFKTINTVLPGDGNGPVNQDILKNGNINVTKEAEVDLYFLLEECLYFNTLAYYCYETSNPPSSVEDIKIQTLAFPNAKAIRDHMSYASGTSVRDYGAMFPGEGIRLHYFENGVDKGTKFPAGTSIGWVLYSNGYKIMSLGGDVRNGNGPIYADSKFMGGISHMAVFRHGDFVIMGYEDSKKTTNTDACDYRDLVFHIASTPADAITGGIPDKDPDPAPSYEQTYQGILTFEDLWPYRGDFDMNDVVVKYVSTVQYNNKNEVTQVKDDYTILWSGATLDNSFAVQNNNIKGNSVQITGGDGNGKVDVTDNSIIRVANNVKKYANDKEKLTFTVNQTYSNPLAKESFVLPPYNPFIAINGDQTKEVHLTNQLPTGYADVKMFGYGHDASQPEKGLYYITFNESEQQMPFAIDIAFVKEADIDGFMISEENKRIDTYYPKFINWVITGGKEDADWYLHPIK